MDILKKSVALLKKAPKWVNDLMHLLSSRINSSNDMLTEHHITSPDLFGGIEFTPEDEVYFRKLIHPKKKK